MVELFEGKLTWSPSTRGTEGRAIDAISLCKASGSPACLSTESFERYSVPHYADESRGCAFGPLGFGSVVWFCRNLAHALESQDAPMQLTTPPGDENMRTNAAVLLGAFLIFHAGWCTERLASTLEEDGKRGFMCSWSRKVQPVEARNMLVAHCWLGFEVALRQGWVDTAFLSSSAVAESLCRTWKHNLSAYDAAWLAPGFIMVSADPVTTALDPSPETFSSVFLVEERCDDEGELPFGQCGSMLPEISLPHKDSFLPKPSSPISDTTASTVLPPDSDDLEIGMYGASQVRMITKYDVDCMSTNTLCKAYGASPIAAKSNAIGGRKKPPSYLSFLLDSGVSMVVRTNHCREPGMPKSGSYNARAFRPYGINHTDIKFLDVNGAVPPHTDVRKMLVQCQEFDCGSGAVLVHCKGGFGRSVLMACCLAIDRFDVPGAALLGWVRIVRPGAVNTPEQEMFLKRFRGRDDLRKFVRLPAGRVGRSSGGTGLGQDIPGRLSDSERQPSCGCSVQ